MPNTMTTLWYNIKSREIYMVTRQVVNTTNAEDGQAMIEYHSINALEPVFVRERMEFLEKFKPLPTIEAADYE